MGSAARHGQVRQIGLADAMTIANGVCGFAAIALLLGMPPASEGWGSAMIDGRLGLVLGLLACGLAFDVLDGVVARRRGPSGLGGHLDLMCDAITFGIVPPLLLIQSPAGDGPLGSVLAPLVGGLYFAAVLVRLAVFATAEDHEHGFIGLPSPSAAVVVLALLVLAPGSAPVLLGVAATAVLMVSSHPWRHPGPLGTIVLSILAAACLGAAFAGWISPGLAAVLEGGCVLLLGPIGTAMRRLLVVAALRQRLRPTLTSSVR